MLIFLVGLLSRMNVLKQNGPEMDFARKICEQICSRPNTRTTMFTFYEHVFSQRLPYHTGRTCRASRLYESVHVDLKVELWQKLCRT